MIPILLTALALTAGAWWLLSAPRRSGPSPTPTAPAPSTQPLPSAAELRARLETLAHQWVDDGGLVRDDGYIYAVDVGQLMTYAALRHDKPLYEKLRAIATDHLIQNGATDPRTRGMVVWRWRPDRAPDASGTTEALRIAQGLWCGYQAWDNPADRDMAITVLHGYTNHAWQGNGFWLICNYYNFGTRALATNSFLVDYDPDLLRQIGSATGDAALLDIAAKSESLLARGQSPCGLIYDLVQPELSTLNPEMDLSIFSPNDVIQVSNSATVAERCATSVPKLGRSVLGFALAKAKAGQLNQYYFGRTGDPVLIPQTQPTTQPDRSPFEPAGDSSYTSLVRLAAKLGDTPALAAFEPMLRQYGVWFADKPYQPRVYVVGELLLALEAVESAGARE